MCPRRTKLSVSSRLAATLKHHQSRVEPVFNVSRKHQPWFAQRHLAVERSCTGAQSRRLRPLALSYSCCSTTCLASIAFARMDCGPPRNHVCTICKTDHGSAKALNSMLTNLLHSSVISSGLIAVEARTYPPILPSTRAKTLVTRNHRTHYLIRSLFTTQCASRPLSAPTIRRKWTCIRLPTHSRSDPRVLTLTTATLAVTFAFAIPIPI